MRKTVQETIDWLKEYYKLDEDIYFVSMTVGDLLLPDDAEVGRQQFVEMCDYVNQSYDIDQDMIDAFEDAFGATSKEYGECSYAPESSSEIAQERAIADGEL